MDTLATISHFGNQSQRPEIYADFYAQFDPTVVAAQGREIVLSRVIHTDETDDRSRHIMITRDQHDINPAMMRRFNDLGAPEHVVPYHADAFELIVTNGVRIVHYNLLSVRGIYRAHINGVEKQYDAANETIFMRCDSEAGQTATLNFNCKTGDGVLRPHNEPAGWILSEQESHAVQATVLEAAAQSIAAVLRNAS